MVLTFAWGIYVKDFGDCLVSFGWHYQQATQVGEKRDDNLGWFVFLWSFAG